MRPDHKNAAQIAVTLFRDRPKLLFAPGRILSRYEPHPGGKITARPKGMPPFEPRKRAWSEIGENHQSTHVQLKPAAATNVTIVVIQPSMFVRVLFTRLSTTVRSFVMSIMINSNGGTENPWTIPDQTSAFMGLMPMKLSAIATTVTLAIVR